MGKKSKNGDGFGKKSKRQLQRLLDRQAILDCVQRYARGLDRHDDELTASAYHSDALDHHGSFTGTPAQFIPWANDLHASEWSAHQHFIANHTVEIDGDVAHAESYVIGVLRRKGQMVVDIGGGRYIDRLERRDGVWRIAARDVVVEWVCVAEGSSALFSADGYTPGTWDRNDVSYRRPLEIEAAAAES
jgi:SnoaL-like domain